MNEDRRETQRARADDEPETPMLGYAAASPLARHGDLFRDGAVLAARDGVMLIPFCILCGAASGDAALRLKFTWDPSFQVTRKSTLQLRAAGTIQARLCPRHFRRWRRGRLLGMSGMVGSAMLMLVSAIVAVLSESSDIPRYVPAAIGGMMIGFALFIGFLFFFTLKTRTVKCVRIEGGYVYLDGVDEAFLERVPELRDGLQ